MPVSIKNTLENYVILLLMSTEKNNFTSLARMIEKSWHDVKTSLPSDMDSLEKMGQIARQAFRETKKIYATLDGTKIKKIYSKVIAGTSYNYDQKTGRRATGIDLEIGTVSDGKQTFPIFITYNFDRELTDLLDQKPRKKIETVKKFLKKIQELFPDKIIIFVADGLYSTAEIIGWCLEDNIKAEMRMASSKVIELNGKKIALKQLLNEPGIMLNQNWMAQTIIGIWCKMELEFTIIKRTDSHDKVSFVFQVATYKARPIEHFKTYKKRWSIEKVFRTSKQTLGLQDCLSIKFATQRAHIAAVFLAYSLAQVQMKKHNFKTTEDAIRSFRPKKQHFSKKKLNPIISIQ